MGNSQLSAAKKAKNDEFYTRMTDIEHELVHYRDHFKGKVVLCNCDDPFESNFFRYFALNFNHLGLKRLIATCYSGSPIADGEYQPALQALLQSRQITAIVCYNDLLAVDCYHFFAQIGVRVPEDVSVCGFDGLPLSDFFLPQLTTVRQSADELADHGARLLLESIEHPGTVRHEVIPFSLAKRESVRPLPPDITQQKA